MKQLTLLLLLLLTGYVALGFLKPGHEWGGDFSLYIRQAQSLSSGQMERVASETRFMIENSTDHTFSPAAYPWGFPLLLWPVVGSDNSTDGFHAPSPKELMRMKHLIILCFLGFMLFYACWARHYLGGWVSLLLTGFVTLQQIYMEYMIHILAEIPYMCFLMASMLAITHLIRLWNRQGSNPDADPDGDPGSTPAARRQYKIALITAFCTGILLLFTAQIRTEGFLLFGVLPATQGVALWQHRKRGRRLSSADWLFMGIPYAGAVLSLGVWSAVLPSGFLSHFNHITLISVATLERNVRALFNGLGGYLPLPFLLMKIFFAGTVCIGWARNFVRDVAPALLMASTMGLFLLWPHYEERYLFSIFPFAAFFFVRGLESVGSVPAWLWQKIVKRKVAAGTTSGTRTGVATLLTPFFLIQVLFGISMIFWHQSRTPQMLSGPCTPNSSEMFNYIRQNTAPTDVVAFFRPRVMCLFAQRRSLALFDDFSDVAQKAQWYVVTLYKGTFYQFDEAGLARYSRYLSEVFRNESFVVFQVLPNPPDH